MTKTLCIQNGEVVLPDRSVPDGTVVIAAGRIEYAGRQKKTPRGAVEFDARGSYVTPGLIDVHIHGAGLIAWETCTAEGLARFDAMLSARGVLRFVPTMMADEAVIRRMAELLKTAPCTDRVPGIYVEGPFINPKKRGGVQQQYVRSVDLDYLARLQQAADRRICMMTFAPELEGAAGLPGAMRRLRILPCPGHSLARSAEAKSVCQRRKVSCTHLFNAMSGLDHREPGLAAFGLDRDEVYVELNPDGTHVAAEMLRLARRVKPADRIVLISDAVISAGIEPGTYPYMNRSIRSTARGVYYADEGTLVGSSILLNEGLARFIRSTGAPVHEAVLAATLNPAVLLGLGRRTGSLEAGKQADVVVFSRDFTTAQAVFVKGERRL